MGRLRKNLKPDTLEGRVSKIKEPPMVCGVVHPQLVRKNGDNGVQPTNKENNPRQERKCQA